MCDCKCNSHLQEIIQSQITFRGSSVGFIELARKCIEAVLVVDSKVSSVFFPALSSPGLIKKKFLN